MLLDRILAATPAQRDISPFFWSIQSVGLTDRGIPQRDTQRFASDLVCTASDRLDPGNAFHIRMDAIGAASVFGVRGQKVKRQARGNIATYWELW